MSFDPYGYQESTPPASGGPPGAPIPSGFAAGGAESADPSAQAEALHRQAREKVSLPAIFLIITGVINLLPAGYFLVNAALLRNRTPEQLEAQKAEMEKNPALKKQFDEMAKQGYTMKDIQNFGVYGCGGTGVAAIVASIFTILGGIRMLQLRSYGLAVFASVLAAVPFMSCLACCGMGEIIGVWSIIVLLNPQVRMMFR
jgi:hypothetical protein